MISQFRWSLPDFGQCRFGIEKAFSLGLDTKTVSLTAILATRQIKVGISLAIYSQLYATPGPM